MGNTCNRPGFAAVWLASMLFVLLGLASLAVDYGRLQVVKTQLRRAADAAARYGASGLSGGNTVAWAKAAAAENIVNGSAFSLQTSDIQTGNFSGGTFTANGTPLNAVQISTGLTASRGNAVSLLFGQAIGMRACNVTTTCVATATSTWPSGLVGINSIITHANLMVSSYSSSTTPTPTPSTDSSSAYVYSNGPITQGGSPNAINGNVQLGPSGSISGISVSGSTTTLGSAKQYPTMAMQVVSNPGGVSQTAVVPNNTTLYLPGGVYYITSFTMNDFGNIYFTGPATVYLDGDASIHDHNNIVAYNNIPSNLVIYQSDGHTFLIHDSDNPRAQLYAPGSVFTASHDHCNWYGAICAKTVSVHDNDNIYCDSDLSGGASAINLVK